MTDRLYRQHGRPCFWCQRQMMRESVALRPTRDHVIPRAQGGTIIKICCHACNNLKGDMPAALWAMLLERFPKIHERFGRPGPRGMALFYDCFGGDLAPHIERIAQEAQARFPEYGEVRL